VAENGPDKPIHVGVMGTWNWLEVAAELLRLAGMTCEVFDMRSRRQLMRWVMQGHWRRFDVIHHLWGGRRAQGVLFAALRKPVVWHWIGSDVLAFKAICRGGGGWRGGVTRTMIYRWSAMHLVDSPQLAEELASCGIPAEVVRLLPKTIEAQVYPLPDKPAVLSYWNPGSRDFYHAPLVLKLAESFPDVKFLIVGDDGAGLPAPGNVKFLGRLADLDDVYRQVSIYLRLVRHDSLSVMVLEAFARGRHVIYNMPCPFSVAAGTFEEVKGAMQRLVTVREPNQAGAEYVRRNYSVSREAENLKSAYARGLRGIVGHGSLR